ncbi:LolA family protein [Jatrophihabitans sp. YIM 134969]
MDVDPVTTVPRRRRAWAVPAAAVVVVAAGAVVFNVSTADANPKLPARTAEQLIASVLASQTRALSGTVTETADLGLPSLPGAASQASLSWQQLLTGTNTAQVWIDGPDRQRLAVTAQLSEADVVHDGDDVWTYTSADDTVSHQVLPAHRAEDAPDPTASMTPTGVARQLLDAVDPTTAVSVSDTATVAGRTAYTLVVEPRDARTTIRQVAIAVDSETGVPLQVEVFGSASTPAFEVGFTRIDFATPPASQFAFTPPAGATVTENPFGGGRPATSVPAGRAPTAAPTVVGDGWTSVVEFPDAKALLTSSNGLLDQLTSKQPDGSRLLHTALVNAVLTTDGRAYVGAVAPDVLQQIARSR